MSTYWAVGTGSAYADKNRVFKNVNGSGWQRVTVPSAYQDGWKSTAVFALRSDFVLVAVSGDTDEAATILKTEDGGVSWTVWYTVPLGVARRPTVVSILGFADDEIYFISHDEWVTGDGGVWYWNGLTVSQMADATTFGMTPPEFQPTGLGGVSGGDFWVVDPGNAPGFFLNHWDGATWDRRDNISGSAISGPRCVSAIATDEVYVLGVDAVQKWNGTVWSLSDTPTFNIQMGVLALNSNDIHVVGGHVPI